MASQQPISQCGGLQNLGYNAETHLPMQDIYDVNEPKQRMIHVSGANICELEFVLREDNSNIDC